MVLQWFNNYKTHTTTGVSKLLGMKFHYAVISGFVVLGWHKRHLHDGCWMRLPADNHIERSPLLVERLVNDSHGDILPQHWRHSTTCDCPYDFSVFIGDLSTFTRWRS